MVEESQKIARRVEELKKTRHCANCGKIDPETFSFAEGEEAALTECCHENVCEHREECFFGNEDVSVKACCWAMAELQFRGRGIDVTQQKGMCRFQ